MKQKRLSLMASLSLLCSGAISADEMQVPYPENYRNWMHVKSMLIESGHPLENPFQGLHHIYANEPALKGLQGGDYADGAVLAFDLLEVTEADNTIQEGDRKLLGVMHKDANKYAETGGWGFEGFAGDSQTERLVTDGGKSCFACHSPHKADDYVFTKWRK
jgi:hypothetical protein